MRPYEWDFDGTCAPGEFGEHPLFVPDQQRTFTLGVFQWLPRARGAGVKRGKVVRRIKGLMADPHSAYEEARADVARRNAEDATGVGKIAIQPASTK